ncbi:MAG: hypothetical protein ABI977_00900 [Acidobacteriota bacterium]
MHKDEILEEIWKIREEHAAKFNYDLDAIYEDLKQGEEEERKRGRIFVSFAEKKVEEMVAEDAPPSELPRS